MNLRNWTVLVFVSIFLHGCGGPKEEVLEYKLGDAVPMGKLFLTIERVDRDVKLDWMGGEAGQEAIMVHLQVENKGKQALGFHVKDIVLNDSSGSQYRGSPHGIGNQLNMSRAIAMGDRFRGPILYVVPKGISGLKLDYVPKNMRNKKFVIDLEQ